MRNHTTWCRLLVVEPGSGLWGAQHSVLRLAAPLERGGIELILAAPPESGLAVRWRAAGGTQVDFAPAADRRIRGASGRLSPYGAVREVGRTLCGAWRLARLARRGGADVILANSHWTHLEAVVAGWIVRRPTLLYLHEQSEPDLLGRLRAIAVRGAALSIAVSSAVRRSLPAWVQPRVVVVANGVDPAIFAPGPPDPDLRAWLTADPKAPLVLVVSRVEPSKGVLDVLRAVHALPEALGDTCVAVVGDVADQAYADRLHRYAAETLGDRMRLVGRHPDVGALLRCADVFVLASDREGMPLTVLEAQASGVPVVAYPAGGTAEVISHGLTGLLARQGDVADLSRQIESSLLDRELTERIIVTARDRICTVGSLRGQADAIVALLRTLLAERSGAS